ncbi:MAG: dual specificity protein phosphatase family protein [Lentisphaeria bacterium]|nr:dual specificity protein phosphatase family protein [Lentisphaeria bacterium]NQZ70281.1 dual specificity protein phosphatase family protein [Lentisphaeria bacterium]
MTNRDIQICSHVEAIELLKQDTDFHVISIRDRSAIGVEFEIDPLLKDVSSITYYFDDIHETTDGKELPAKKKVEEILDWSTDKQRIIVHCNAGMGRSPAIAYLILCQDMPAAEAIAILEPERHIPNHVVLKLGTELLGDDEIWTEFETFMTNDHYAKIIDKVRSYSNHR